MAVRLGLELKPGGGDSAANADDTRRLLSDPDTWGDPDGPTERTMSEYLAYRAFPKSQGTPPEFVDKVLAHSIGEIEFWDREFARLDRDAEPATGLWMRIASHAAVNRVRHRCFAALCGWERQLTYVNTNERIFTRFQSTVDSLLETGAPDLLEKFGSVYRRLREGAASDPNRDVGDELAEALVTCRRILEAVVDHVYPPGRPATLADGSEANPTQYRARLFAFLGSDVESDSMRGALEAEFEGLYQRFKAADKLANRGVHADIALTEAEMCAISTYILTGQILQFTIARPSAPASEDGPDVAGAP